MHCSRPIGYDVLRAPKTSSRCQRMHEVGTCSFREDLTVSNVNNATMTFLQSFLHSGLTMLLMRSSSL